MIVLSNFVNIFKIPELMRKLSFTLGVLMVYRIGVHIPVSGINVDMLTSMLKSSSSIFSGFWGYIDTFAGGALANCAIFALGISPYINASIVMQIATMAIPYFEALSKEGGEFGRMQINQYTRYLTLLLSIFYGAGLLGYLSANNLILVEGLGFKLFFILSVSTGSMFVMWLGEQISLQGLGNGSSLLIFASIVSSFPLDASLTALAIRNGSLSWFMAAAIISFFLAVAAAIVFLEKGERKIPVQYARRIVGNKVYGGQSSYIPFKINNVGVMPAIFATTVLSAPQLLFGFLSRYVVDMSSFEGLVNSFAPRGLMYNVLTFLLIILFTFVYTSILFDPQELANNMKKNGGFVPGIRPGKQTADYFDHILTRIGLVGALYLAALALLPNIAQMLVTMPFVLGGTSLLIVVGVALELSSQIESYLLEHNYSGFLSSGRRAGTSRVSAHPR